METVTAPFTTVLGRLARIIILVLAFAGLLILTQFTAQAGTPDEQLYAKASAAYPSSCLDVAINLGAFIERDPPQMQDPTFANTVNGYFDGCYSYLWAAEQAAKQKGEQPDDEVEAHMMATQTNWGLPPLPPASASKPAASSSSSNPPAPTVRSYPMVCRGGGNLHFTYTPYSNFSQKPQIWIRFFGKASTRAGSNLEYASGFNPGECAWLDRTISSAEPEMIIIADPVLKPNDFSVQWQSGQVMGLASGLLINPLQTAKGFVKFNVYNDGRGNFIVTGSQEVKP